MATLEEILAQVGLSDVAPSQTKTAAAANPSSKEVNKVLEDLGLSGVEDLSAAGVTKTASEERNHMGLTEVYESLFGEAAPAATEEGQEKVAAAEGEATTEGTEEVVPSTSLGELVGVYFNVLEDAYVEKVAGDLEMEAGAGHKPFAHQPAAGELSRIVGKEGDPMLPKNHDASSGAGLKVTTGGNTPYSLKAKAQIKAILKRTMKSEAGDIGGVHE